MSQSQPSLPLQGRRARLELAPDAYELWKVGRPEAPVARFDRTQLGWEAAWREFSRLERSGWRSPKVGWIILHALLIGAFGMGLVEGLLIAAFGDNPDVVVDTTNGFRLFVGGDTGLVTMATGAAGWLMFVYLRASLAARWAALVVSLIAGVALGLAMGSA